MGNDHNNPTPFTPQEMQSSFDANKETDSEGGE